MRRLALAIALAGGVVAAAAGAAEQIGVLTAKDVVRRTVTIDEREYPVSAAAVIVGKRGERLEFGEIPVDVSVVWAYELMETRAGDAVTRLEMREAPR